MHRVGDQQSSGCGACDNQQLRWLHEHTHRAVFHEEPAHHGCEHHQHSNNREHALVSCGGLVLELFDAGVQYLYRRGRENLVALDDYGSGGSMDREVPVSDSGPLGQAGVAGGRHQQKKWRCATNSRDCRLYCFSPALNSAQGLAFMSFRIGRCQSNSGCSFRNLSAMKSSPHGCPALACSVMFLAIVASAACAVTDPIGAYGGSSHIGSPVGEVSPCPHKPRRLRSSLPSYVSQWSARNLSPSSTSIWPLFAGISSSQRLRRALGELDMLFGLKSVSALVNAGSLGKFAPTKYPFLVRQTRCNFSPSSKRAISPVLLSASSQSLA